MKKSVVFLMLASVLCVGVAGQAFAAVPKGKLVDTAVSEDSLVFWGILFEDDKISSSDLFVTSKFTATKGEGDNIRVWFKNTSNANVTVRLYKEGLFGRKEEVLKFDVKSKVNNSGIYNKAGSATYHIEVLSDTGDTVTGYLKAKQL